MLWSWTMSHLRRARSRLLFALSASPRLRWRCSTSKCLTLFVVVIFLFCIFAKIVFLPYIFVSTQNLRTRIVSAPPARWQRVWTATRGEVGSNDYKHIYVLYVYNVISHAYAAGRFCQLCSNIIDVDINDTGCIKPLADHGIEELEEGWCFLENLQVSIRSWVTTILVDF